jgi:hypothetical protein
MWRKGVGVAALVLGIGLTGCQAQATVPTSTTSSGVGAPATPATYGSTGQAPLTSPAGKLYHAGEFCSRADLGVSTQGSDGTITCAVDNGYNRWLRG